MKTYKRDIRRYTDPTTNKTIVEDKRASQIEAMFEKEIELLGNQYEHHYIECELRFNPISGYYFEMSINDEDTDFSDKTTEDVNGRLKSEVIAGLKNSYSYLVEALECHKKECENELYSESKYGNPAEYDNY